MCKPKHLIYRRTSFVLGHLKLSSRIAFELDTLTNMLTYQIFIILSYFDCFNYDQLDFFQAKLDLIVDSRGYLFKDANRDDLVIHLVKLFMLEDFHHSANYAHYSIIHLLLEQHHYSITNAPRMYRVYERWGINDAKHLGLVLPFRQQKFC